MGFWRDGEKVTQENVPEGRMTENQVKYFARKFARHAMDIAERRSYGIGEVGYYINEDCIDLIDAEIATIGEASKIASMADELMNTADDMGMTIDVSYNSFYEEERRVEKEDK